MGARMSLVRFLFVWLCSLGFSGCVVAICGPQGIELVKIALMFFGINALYALLERIEEKGES